MPEYNNVPIIVLQKAIEKNSVAYMAFQEGTLLNASLYP